MTDIGRQYSRIVDQTFPSYSGPRFLKVHPHNDMQVILSLICVGFEQLGVLDGSLNIMHRAGSDDYVLVNTRQSISNSYPTTTISRSSLPLSIFSVARRPSRTVCAARSVLHVR